MVCFTIIDKRVALEIMLKKHFHILKWHKDLKDFLLRLLFQMYHGKIKAYDPAIFVISKELEYVYFIQFTQMRNCRGEV